MTITQMLPAPPVAHVRDRDLPPADDLFFYGWRDVLQGTNGTEEWIRQPLTLADVLHPQWGDSIMQNQEHFSLCKDLFNQLEIHLRDELGTELLHDTLIDWEEPGKKGLCPDIAVIREVRKPFRKGVFYVKQSRGHVDVVLEITSPSTWKVDVEGYRTVNKVTEYAKVGVPFYIIVDDTHRQEGKPTSIIAYGLGKRGRYKKLAPEKRGRYWIETVGLWIGPYEDWVSWYDPEGNKLGTHIEEFDARRRAEVQARLADEKARAEVDARKRAEAETRAEADARQRAEVQARLADEKACAEADARKRAEAETRAEANARQRAEVQARVADEKACAEADARKRAEAETRAEADARKRAEAEVRAEADARQRAETRIRELEALLGQRNYTKFG